MSGVFARKSIALQTSVLLLYLLWHSIVQRAGGYDFLDGPQVLVFFCWLVMAGVFFRSLTTEAPRFSSLAPPGDRLQLVRILAFIAVALTHSSMLAKNEELVRSFSAPALGAARAGMWIFFTLSGYLIFKQFQMGKYALDRPGLGRFFRARVRRIVPLYVFSQAVILLFDYFAVGGVPTLSQVARNLVFYAPLSPFIGALWSIIAEMHFYVMAPILFFLSHRWRGFALVVAAGVIAYRFHVYESWGRTHADWMGHIYATLIGNLDCFMIGGAVNVYQKTIQRIFRRAQVSFGAAFITLLALYLICSYIDIPGFRELSLFFFVWAPSVVALLTAAVVSGFELGALSPRARSFLGARPVLYFGALTYGLYVWHSPILEHLLPLLEPAKDGVIYSERVVLALLLTFALASVVYHQFEKRFLRH